MTVAPPAPMAGIPLSRNSLGRSRDGPTQAISSPSITTVPSSIAVSSTQGSSRAFLDAGQSWAGCVHLLFLPDSERDEREVLARYGFPGGQPDLGVTVVVFVALRSEPDGSITHEADDEARRCRLLVLGPDACHTRWRGWKDTSPAARVIVFTSNPQRCRILYGFDGGRSLVAKVRRSRAEDRGEPLPGQLAACGHVHGAVAASVSSSATHAVTALVGPGASRGSPGAISTRPPSAGFGEGVVLEEAHTAGPY